MSETIKFCKKSGYGQYIWKKTHITGINDKKFNVRIFRKAAINAPIQGSASEIMRLAMIRLNDEIENSKENTKMLLQIHDEFIFEVNENTIKKSLN